MTTNQKILISDYLKDIFKSVKKLNSGIFVSSPMFVFDQKKEKELLTAIVDIEKEISNESHEFIIDPDAETIGGGAIITKE